jgi:hypothetical protein
MIEKKITICVGTDRSKHFAVRLSLMLVDDGRILSEQYHRINIAPGADLAIIRALNEAHLADPKGSVPGSPWPSIPDDEWAEVEAMIGIVHKPEVVAAYEAQLAAQQAEEQRLADEQRLAEAKSGNAQAGRASIGALAMVVAVALSGCAAATAYVQQHAAGLAATALVAGTAAQVSGALINADELERRIEQRASPDENKAKR